MLRQRDERGPPHAAARVMYIRIFCVSVCDSLKLRGSVINIRYSHRAALFTLRKSQYFVEEENAATRR